MSLPDNLISQFAKITKNTKKSKDESTVYGTIVAQDGIHYVRLDGSELLTPISTVAKVYPGERVMVMIKNHTAIVTGNMSSPSASSDDVDGIRKQIAEFDIILADKVDTKELNAERARIDSLVTDNVTIKETLSAQSANIGKLQAKDVEITGELTAVKADITTLSTKKLDAETARITYATINELKASNATIGTLSADLASINTLIFGSATGDTIQTTFSNAVIAQLGNAQIKSAMIESVSASKITAGDIITNNVRVKSEDGSLIISDETMQISDGTRVRVQIGKDASNDYSINIWDASGNLMFSQGGITDSAIKEAIIRNDMVSDTANIAAHKLDIDSLFEEINGSTNTIKSSKVYLDENKQTLDVAFKSLSTTVTSQGETITSQGTAISTIQGQITSKIWQQDINAAKNEMSTQYSTLNQELDTLSVTVASHTTQISKKADSTTVTNVADRVTTLETGLDGFKSTVSETYATKAALNTTNSNVSTLTTRMTSAETSITQLSNKITANVAETTNLGTRVSTVEQTASGLTTRLNNQVIGGTNILRGTNTMTAFGSSSPWSSGGWRKAGGGTGERTVISITDAPNADITKGFEIVGISDDAVISQDGVPITEGVEYTISCYARGSGNLVLRVGKSPYDTGYHNLSNQTTWKRYSYTFVAGLGTSGNGNALVNGKTNIYFGNNGEGTMELCGFKFEMGNVATDWTPSPYDFDSGIDAAAKTATNYLSFSSAGLVIGDMTASSLGKNVLIDSDSVDIRNGNTTLASFGADYLYLAKNSRNAKIDLCNGLATLYHESKYSYDTVFIIDTGNTTELISNTSVPLCVTSGNTAFPKVSVQFAIGEEIVGGLGIVKSTATDNSLVRMGANMVKTYTVLDSGNYYNVMDSGWFYTGGYGEKFSQYNNETHSKVRYRKIGRTVEVRGAMKPVTTITGSTTQYELFTLPEGYRPDCLIYQRCQGSGTYTWMLTIRPDGMATFSRYGNGSEYVDVGTSIWLPFQITFFTD